jgi:hypothetical protein
MVSKEEMELSSWRIYCTKNKQKLTGDEKVIGPQSKGGGGGGGGF